MSDTAVACAACRHPFVAPAPRSIVLPRDAGAEQAVLDDVLLTALCPACGARNDVEPSSMLFTDLVRRWYVVVLPIARSAEAERLEQVVEQSFRRELDPDVWDRPELVKRRIVFGREALREKVLLWGRGMDDGVLESLKAAMIDTDAGREHALRGMRIRRIDDKIVWFSLPGREALLDVDLTAYLTMYTIRDQLVDRWPALFRPGWVDATRIV